MLGGFVPGDVVCLYIMALVHESNKAGIVKNSPLWQLHSVESLGHIVCYISFSKYVHISAKHFH